MFLTLVWPFRSLPEREGWGLQYRRTELILLWFIQKHNFKCLVYLCFPKKVFEHGIYTTIFTNCYQHHDTETCISKDDLLMCFLLKTSTTILVSSNLSCGIIESTCMRHRRCAGFVKGSIHATLYCAVSPHTAAHLGIISMVTCLQGLKYRLKIQG